MLPVPVIAIVGRPNVGKSTLFNYLTQSRAALVSDFPGMTRDRQYGEGRVGKRKFIVIDTGGIVGELPSAKESQISDLKKNRPLKLIDKGHRSHQSGAIEELISGQSHQAIEEANHVIFLVDARSGLTPDDQKIAEKLRAFGKKIILAVNKTEGLNKDTAAVDFHQLGLGFPHPIAAAHGQGIEDLIKNMLPETPAESDADKKNDRIQLALIGRPNVGKSTLTNRMLGEQRVIVFDQPGTTRDSIFIPLERDEKKYTLIDTAGIRRRGKVFEATEKFSVVKTLQAIECANVVLFLMDATEGVTEQDMRLLGFILDCGKGLVIAFNKWDGLSVDEKEHARATLDRRLRFISFARVHFISALHGTGVGNLFDSINEAYASAFKKLSTPKLSKLLEQAVLTHTPPLVKGRRIKLRYAHSGGHNPPIIVIHGNQLESLPNAYKKYLEHTFQQHLNLFGTPVKIEFKSSVNPFKPKKAKKLTGRQRYQQRVERGKRRRLKGK